MIKGALIVNATGKHNISLSDTEIAFPPCNLGCYNSGEDFFHKATIKSSNSGKMEREEL